MAVSEIYRVLKPSGKLFLSTPSKRAINVLKRPFRLIERPIKKLLDKKRNIKQNGYGYYDNPFYPEELITLLQKHSFVVFNYIRTNILFPTSFYGFLPLKITKLMLRMSTFMEDKMLRFFLPLTSSCLVGCYKVDIKEKAQDNY